MSLNNSQGLNSEEFKNYAANTLFDICSCKCSDIFNCSYNRLRKVSEIEKNFLVDRRTVRKIAIGREDVKETKRNKKRLQRQDRSAIEDIPIMMDDNLPILPDYESDKMSDVEFPIPQSLKKKRKL